MNPKTIKIDCSGYSIDADWYEPTSTNSVLLVLVGYGSSKARNSDFVKDVSTNTGTSALVIDYSGHGDSPINLDKTRPAQHFLEIISAFDWLRATYPHAKVSVMGTSYGGFMAALLASYRDFEKLILRTPAIYIPSDFYSTQAEIEREGATQKYRHNSSEIAKNPIFTEPRIFSGQTLLVVHGNDEDVPTTTTDRYQQAFSADTYTATGFKHAMRDPANPTDKLAEYQNFISDWLKKS